MVKMKVVGKVEWRVDDSVVQMAVTMVDKWVAKRVESMVVSTV